MKPNERQLLITIDKDLHQRFKERLKAEGKFMSRQIALWIEQYLAKKEGQTHE
jgi:hypothetical protein